MMSFRCSAAEGSGGERVLPLRVQAWGTRVAADSGHAHLRPHLTETGGRGLSQLRAQVTARASYPLSLFIYIPECLPMQPYF